MKEKYEQYSQFYQRMTKNVRNHPSLIRFLVVADKFFAFAFAVIYPASLLFLFLNQPFSWLLVFNKIGLPACCFVAVSGLRILIKRPRPYEKVGAGIDSIAKKRKDGNSMPSRHVASAFVISMVLLPEILWLGITLLISSVCLGALRIFLGVHYPSDVFLGGVIGLLFGAIGLL